MWNATPRRAVAVAVAAALVVVVVVVVVVGVVGCRKRSEERNRWKECGVPGQERTPWSSPSPPSSPPSSDRRSRRCCPTRASEARATGANRRRYHR